MDKGRSKKTNEFSQLVDDLVKEHSIAAKEDEVQSEGDDTDEDSSDDEEVEEVKPKEKVVEDVKMVNNETLRVQIQ